MRLLFWKKREYHTVKYKGTGNKIILHNINGDQKVNPKFIADVKVKFEGNNSKLDIYEPYSLPKSKLILRNNDHFTLNKVSGYNFNVIGGEWANLYIGEGTTLQNTKIFLNNEKGASVSIGKDCMFSFDIEIWASDTHQILDNTTKQILNRAKCGIKIGSHVWCGTKTIILKDAKISNNSIIGANSLVTKQFDEKNIIVAGNPARKVKSNIIWKREGLN